MTLPEKINTVKTIINSHLKVDIGSKSRRRDIVQGRQFYYKWMRDNTRYSLKMIGQSLPTKQDHSSICHAIEAFDNQVIIYKGYKKEWDAISFKIKERFGDNRVVENEFSYAFNPS